MPATISVLTTDSLLKKYKSLTYFDSYGSSALVMVCLTLVVLLGLSYCAAMVRSSEIKEDWVNQRCRPHIIPFAGMINRPPNMGVGEFTKQNFEYCTQKILSESTGSMLAPLTFILESLAKTAGAMVAAVNKIREMFAKVRGQLRAIVKELMGRVMNIMIPLQQIIISARDMLAKIQGTMAAALFTVLGAYMTLKTLLGSIAEFIVMILIVFAALIAGLWAVPFTWGFAAANTAIFVAISIPMAIILSFMKTTLHLDPNLSIPSVCFDGNTYFCQGQHRTKLKRATPGNVLEQVSRAELDPPPTTDGTNYITATMKLAAPCTNNMYVLNGVRVTGDHLVRIWSGSGSDQHSETEFGSLVKVCDHPSAKKVANYTEPYVYCINASWNKITLGGTTYSDWNGLSEPELRTLTDVMNAGGVGAINMVNLTPVLISEWFDGGFFEYAPVHLASGSVVRISQIEVGDVLADGDVVYGTVKVLFDPRRNIVHSASVCGYNVHWCDTDTETSAYNSNQSIRPPTHRILLYHLLTQSKKFNVGGRRTYDYNYQIDSHLHLI